MTEEQLDKIISDMSLRQKLGQLIMSRAKAKNIEENLAKGEIGGLYFANNANPELIKKFKELSPFPLFIAQDLELGKTIGGPLWPSAMAVSSADNMEDAYLWAYLHAKQARSFGINTAYGPVLDLAVSDLADNTGYRSVGSDPERVAEYCALMIRGYQDAGIIPFAKHFPGFGRCPSDPHIQLSILDVDYDTIVNEELLPYRKAIEEENLMGIMSGHVLAESVDSLPSTVSKKWMDILRNDLGFNGLIMTDSLAMQGILQYDNSQYLYENTLLAGHDIFLANYNVPDSVCLDYLEEAVKEGRLPLELVEQKVHRVMTVKYKLEQAENLPWNEAESKAVYERIGQNAPAYIRGDGGEFLPLDKNKKYLCIMFTAGQAMVSGELGVTTEMDGVINGLHETFPNMEVMSMPLCPSGVDIQRVLSKSHEFDKVIFIAQTTFHAYMSIDRLSHQAQAIMKALRHKTEMLVIWGNPFAYRAVYNYVPQVLFAYDSNCVGMHRFLSGELAPKGKLPVTI